VPCFPALQLEQGGDDEIGQRSILLPGDSFQPGQQIGRVRTLVIGVSMRAL